MNRSLNRKEIIRKTDKALNSDKPWPWLSKHKILGFDSPRVAP